MARLSPVETITCVCLSLGPGRCLSPSTENFSTCDDLLQAGDSPVQDLGLSGEIGTEHPQRLFPLVRPSPWSSWVGGSFRCPHPFPASRQQQQVGLLRKFHRQVVCWLDEWVELTIEDIRRMEAKIAAELLGVGELRLD